MTDTYEDFAKTETLKVHIDALQQFVVQLCLHLTSTGQEKISITHKQIPKGKQLSVTTTLDGCDVELLDATTPDDSLLKFEDKSATRIAMTKNYTRHPSGDFK
jgi:hypothetical protein